MKTYHVLSLGAGVQSSTLLLMACKGELPKPDAAVFADTGWEHAETYRHMEFLQAEGKRHGIPVVWLKGRDIRRDAINSKIRGAKSDGDRWASMPLFVRTRYVNVVPCEKYKDGKRPVDWDAPKFDGENVGQIQRQCTKDYKISQVEKWIRTELLGLKPRQRAPKDVRVYQWMGISADEMRRVKQGNEYGRNWSRLVYPLIFDIRKGPDVPEFRQPMFDRRSCEEWLKCNYRGLTIRPSLCIGCPFQPDDYWLHMRENEPENWEDVCQFDEAIRWCGGMRGPVYVHRSGVPLREVELKPRVKKEGAPDLFVGFSCGTCGT